MAIAVRRFSPQPVQGSNALGKIAAIANITRAVMGDASAVEKVTTGANTAKTLLATSAPEAASSPIERRIQAQQQEPQAILQQGLAQAQTLPSTQRQSVERDLQQALALSRVQPRGVV